MTRAQDQLPEEATYPHLAKFLRMGGTLEVGDNHTVGSFANIRMANRILTVHSKYRDLASVLGVMEAQARSFFEQQS